MLSLALSVGLNPFDHDRDAVDDTDAQAKHGVAADAVMQRASGRFIRVTAACAAFLRGRCPVRRTDRRRI